MTQNISSLQQIYDQVVELNRRNNLLKAKYENDEKYAKLHKRVIEKGNISDRESLVYQALMDIKKQADEKVLINNHMLDNEGFFVQFMSPLVVNGFEKQKINLDPEAIKYINGYVVNEYINEYNGKVLC